MNCHFIKRLEHFLFSNSYHLFTLFVYDAATYCDLKGKMVQIGEPKMFASNAKLNILFLRLSLGFSFCLLVFELMSVWAYACAYFCTIFPFFSTAVFATQANLPR